MKENGGTHLDQLTLSMMVDDVFTGAESARLHRHLEECKQCELAYEDMQAMSFAMVKMEEMPVPEGMFENIMGNLPQQDAVDESKVVEMKEYQMKKSGEFKFSYVAGFAACVAFGFFAFGQSPELETADHRGGDAGVVMTEGRTSDMEEGISVIGEEGEVAMASPMMRDFSLEELEEMERNEEEMAENQRDLLAPDSGLSLNSIKMFEEVFHDSLWAEEPEPHLALFFNEYPGGTILGDMYGKELWVSGEEVPDISYLKLTYSEEMDGGLREYLLGEYAELSTKLRRSGVTELLLVYPTN